MKRIDHEVINHGFCHSQYFQGCGTAFSRFEHVSTGAGMSAREAYEDAAEQAYSWPGIPDGYALPKCPRSVRSGIVPSDCRGGVYWYVSIRFNLPKVAE